MSVLNEFGDTAKALSKNPLGIIALFIVLIYGFAALVVGSSSQLGPNERYPIVWFLVIFPVIVLGVFGWLVSQHYEKLYAPRDFNNDESFLKALHEKQQGRGTLRNLDAQIEEKVKNVLASDEMVPEVANKEEFRKKLQEAAETITSQIRSSSFITVDARSFTGSDEDVFELPVDALPTLNDLTNEIYFAISEHVRPYEYGYSWVLRNTSNGEIIKNARMITGTQRGVPLKDSRTLPEVGIMPGTVLEVFRPKNG